MSTPHLIYFADPMCSWCYGFSPVLDDIRHAFGRALPIRVVMGGLRPGTDTPMTEAAKLEIAGHWRHVHDATGLPFNPAGMAREGFLYDTDPAARASSSCGATARNWPRPTWRGPSRPSTAKAAT